MLAGLCSQIQAAGRRLCRRSLVQLISLCCFLLWSPSTLAQPPAHLSEMPSVSDVEQKVTGQDALDTAARQSATFRHLSWAVRSLSEGGEFGNRLSPEEAALIAEYQQAGNAAFERGKAALVAAGAPAAGPDSIANQWRRAVDDLGTEGDRRQLIALVAPKILKAYDARKGADSSAFDRLTAAKQSGSSKRRTGALVGAGMVLLGLLMGAFSLFMVMRVGRADRAIRKEAFERRSAGGVLQFDTFEQAEAFEQRQRMNRIAGCGPATALLISIFVLLAGVFVLMLALR